MSKKVKMATEAQMATICKICGRIPAEKLARIIEIIVDCREGNVLAVERNAIRALLGLKPLVRKVSEPKVEDTIEDVDIIIVPATTQEFVARKKFVPDIRSDALVKILSLNEHFREHYLGKIEEPNGKTRLRYRDRVSVEELGGEDKAEITLKELFFVLGKPGKRESGIAHVRDVCGVLGKVVFFWKTRGWVLTSYDLDVEPTSLVSQILIHD